MIVTLGLATSEAVESGTCLFRITREYGDNAAQQRVFEQARDVLPMDMGYHMSGDGRITFHAPADQLTPSVVSSLQTKFDAALRKADA